MRASHARIQTTMTGNTNSEPDAASTDEVMAMFIPFPGKHWSLVQTRPRNEKYARQNIAGQGIITYLPLITRVEIHNRSSRKRVLPMFPGYLFACPSLEEETLIRRDKCVWNVRILNASEEEELLRDLQVVRKCELLSLNRKLVVNPQLQVGDTVRLKNGPFKNHEVIVARRENETKIIVNLNFLGRNVEIACNADDLVY